MKTHLPLCLCVFLALPGWAQPADELAQLREENAALREQVQTLLAEVESLRARVAELQGETDALQNRSDELEALAGLVPQTERVQGQAARIEHAFDEETQTSTVTTRADALTVNRGSRQAHWMSCVYTYPGEPGSHPATPTQAVQWHLMTQRTGSLYRRLESATLRIDEDETITLLSQGYDRTFRRERGNDRSDERFYFALDLETLRRLSNAVTAELELGPVRITLTPDQIATFRALVLRIEQGL